MKPLSLLFVTFCLVLTSCVQTSYEKSISVTRDANGKIISTTVTETVIQPPFNGGQSQPIKFQYLHKWWELPSEANTGETPTVPISKIPK